MSDDRELEREAEALRAAYRKLPRVEPPPALDRAVLAQARAALVRQQPAATVRRPRWLLPVGLAATAVLAIGVAWRMDLEPKRWPSGPAAPAAAPEAQAPVGGADAPGSGSAPRANEAEPKLEGEAAAGREAEMKSDLGRLSDKDAQDRRAATETDTQLRQAQPEFRDAEQPEKKRPAQPEDLRRVRSEPPPKPVLESAPVTMPDQAPASTAAPAPEPFPNRDDGAVLKEEAARPEGQLRKQAAPAAKRSYDAPAYAPASPPPPAPPAAPAQNTLAAPAEAERSDAAASAAAPAADQLEAAQSKTPRAKDQADEKLKVQVSGTRVETRGAAGATRAGKPSAIAPAERERPESWLEAIRRVMADGDEAEARRELQRFRQRYPSHEIPEDLGRLIR